MKKIYYYLAGMIISTFLVLFSITILGNTLILGPILIVLSAYLFIGCLIKLCKINKKLKDTIICALDLLWWLP